MAAQDAWLGDPGPVGFCRQEVEDATGYPGNWVSGRLDSDIGEGEGLQARELQGRGQDTGQRSRALPTGACGGLRRGGTLCSMELAQLGSG